MRHAAVDGAVSVAAPVQPARPPGGGADLRAVGIADRLRALDATFGMPPPRTPPPWSPTMGPLRVYAEQLEVQRAVLRVLSVWLAAAVLAVVVQHPWTLVLPVVAGGAGLLLARVVPHDGLPWRSIMLAREAPGGVPLRRRARWWPYIVGSAAGLTLFTVVLVATVADVSPVRWAPALSTAVILLLGDYPVFLRAQRRLAAWEQQHGARVLVPVVGWRSPARGGCYLLPTGGPAGAAFTSG
jgi:hypothetical protein